jgi:hypothetical protein
LELDGMYHKDKDCVLTFKKVEKTLYFDEIVNLKYEENEKGYEYILRMF